MGGLQLGFGRGSVACGHGRSSQIRSTDSPGEELVDRLRHDRQGVGDRQSAQDVAALATGEPDPDPAGRVADGSTVPVAVGPDAQECAPAAGALVTASVEQSRRSVSRSRRRWPASRRIAGRTNSSNVTNVDDRVAGQPERGRRRRRRSAPKANGLPGWTATRHRSTLPIASKAVFTTSYGPTDTPPATMTASASADPRREPGQDVVEVVAGDAEVDRRRRRPLATSARRPARSRPGSRPARAARRGRDLVAGRQDRDPRPPVDGHRRRPAPAASATAAGVIAVPGLEDRRAGAEVLARAGGRSRPVATAS